MSVDELGIFWMLSGTSDAVSWGKPLKNRRELASGNEYYKRYLANVGLKRDALLKIPRFTHLFLSLSLSPLKK